MRRNCTAASRITISRASPCGPTKAGGSSTARPVLLLRNHGPVAIGRTLAHAFSLMWLLHRACEVQVATHALGEPLEIDAPILDACARDSLNLDPRHGAGQDAFDALQRIVDRIDPGYRS